MLLIFYSGIRTSNVLHSLITYLPQNKLEFVIDTSNILNLSSLKIPLCLRALIHSLMRVEYATSYRVFNFLKKIEYPQKIQFADFGLAIASGLAAALCIVSGLATYLVGIAVATSIVPPAANMGLLLTMGQPDLALGSLIILLINLLCINFVCTITFFVAGVKSPVRRKRMEKITARTFRKHLIIVFFAILLLVLVIVLAII